MGPIPEPEPKWLFYFVVLLTSGTGSLVLTPLAQRLALRLGFMDHPGGRKIHTASTPYLGGVAIYSGFLLSLLSVVGYQHPLTAIFVGGTILLLCGLWDDKRGMDPRLKLLAQLLAATVVINAEIQFTLTGHAWLDLPLSVFWIVGLTNSLNLLDNMDGLSSGIAAIAASFLFVIAARNGQFLVATMALSLAGACLGFLFYNFAPATIFMGDAGSMFLGYMLAVTALKLRAPDEGPHTFWIPVLVMGLPILDTTLVTLQRIAHRRPIYLGAKDHCSHRLVAMGLSKPRAVVVLYVFGIAYGLAALAVTARNAPITLSASWIASAVSLIAFSKLSRAKVYGSGG